MHGITPEMLRELLRYEPDTGKLFWLSRSASMYQSGDQPAAHKAAAWNARYAGKEALTANCNGYRIGTIFNKPMKSHRVAWAFFYGTWPDQVDHINGIKNDNRIENLRSVTTQENHRNKPRPRHNTSGVIGVCWSKTVSKWAAQIKVDEKSINIGRFDSFDDAVAARKAAEIEYGFHANHGRAAA